MTGQGDDSARGASGIASIKVELVRPGPRHGQLISPLTNYIALCDGVEADTIHLPFAHHELLADIEALRYSVGRLNGVKNVPNELRAAAVDRLSQRVADVLGNMRGFQTRVAQIGGTHDCAHVRLVLGGSELALVPFELATGPTGWCGAGDKLLLQHRAPLLMTRELRDSSSRTLRWNRPPRVLVCSASPEGSAPPPLRQHVFKIVEALEPYVSQRRPISKALTVLENASVEKIEAAMSQGVNCESEYTHVHFICHGKRISPDTDRWGLALCDDRDPSQLRVADVLALRSALAPKEAASRLPTMVMLASCDSANQGAVEMPGASLAYALHQEGIPWVIASTLPLTYGGSWALAGHFYRGVLRGDDPRLALNTARVQVARQFPDTHDWASIVAYASFPADFREQLGRFKIARSRALADSVFERLVPEDESRDGAPRAQSDERALAERQKELAQVDEAMVRWREALQAMGRWREPGDTTRPSSDLVRASSADRAEYWGMCGANTKRKAEIARPQDRRLLLEQALEYYGNGIQEEKPNHWVAVQHLSLCRLLTRAEPQWLRELACATALSDFVQGPSGPRMWAAGSLLELCILDGERYGGRDYKGWAEELMTLAGSQSFHLHSTKRQLRRYTGWWSELFAIEEIVARARRALDLLSGADRNP